MRSENRRNIMFLKKLLVVFTLFAVTLVMGLNYSQSIAETPNIYHKDIEIIPDPNRPGYFTFIGNMCVDSDGGIMDPKVMLYSDLEQLPLWLNHVYSSDECFGAVQKIAADDPDSIYAKIVSYGNSTVIEEMEQKIEELKSLQAQQGAELQKIRSEKFYEHHQDQIDDLKRVSDSMFETGKLLQKETADYYNTMAYLHPPVKP
jgi:hypothetical protein